MLSICHQEIRTLTTRNHEFSDRFRQLEHQLRDLNFKVEKPRRSLTASPSQNPAAANRGDFIGKDPTPPSSVLELSAQLEDSQQQIATQTLELQQMHEDKIALLKENAALRGRVAQLMEKEKARVSLPDSPVVMTNLQVEHLDLQRENQSLAKELRSMRRRMLFWKKQVEVTAELNAAEDSPLPGIQEAAHAQLASSKMSQKLAALEDEIRALRFESAIVSNGLAAGEEEEESFTPSDEKEEKDEKDNGVRDITLPSPAHSPVCPELDGSSSPKELQPSSSQPLENEGEAKAMQEVEMAGLGEKSDSFEEVEVQDVGVDALPLDDDESTCTSEKEGEEEEEEEGQNEGEKEKKKKQAASYLVEPAAVTAADSRDYSQDPSMFAFSQPLPPSQLVKFDPSQGYVHTQRPRTVQHWDPHLSPEVGTASTYRRMSPHSHSRSPPSSHYVAPDNAHFTPSPQQRQDGVKDVCVACSQLFYPDPAISTFMCSTCVQAVKMQQGDPLTHAPDSEADPSSNSGRHPSESLVVYATSLFTDVK